MKSRFISFPSLDLQKAIQIVNDDTIKMPL